MKARVRAGLPPRRAVEKYRQRLERAKAVVPDPTVLMAERRVDRPDWKTLRLYGEQLQFVLRDYDRLLGQVEAMMSPVEVRDG